MWAAAEGRSRKRPFASHLPGFDEDGADDAAMSATEDARSPAPQRRRSSRGTYLFFYMPENMMNSNVSDSATLGINSSTVGT